MVGSALMTCTPSEVPRRDRRQRRGRRRPLRAARRAGHPHRRRPVRPLRAPGRCPRSASTTASSRRSPTCRHRSPSARSSRPTTSRCTSTAARRAGHAADRGGLRPGRGRDARVFWTTGSALAESRPLRAPRRLGRPRPPPHTPSSTWTTADVLDKREAAREQLSPRGAVTVAVGNLDECHTAVGERDPYRAAPALLRAGSSWRWSSRAPKGVLARTRTSWSRSHRSRSRW